MICRKKNGGRYGPRLFPTLRGAQNSLNSWLRGPYVDMIVHDIEWPYLQDVMNVQQMRVDNRHMENMEIVEFNLQEGAVFRKD